MREGHIFTIMCHSVHRGVHPFHNAKEGGEYGGGEYMGGEYRGLQMDTLRPRPRKFVPEDRRLTGGRNAFLFFKLLEN